MHDLSDGEHREGPVQHEDGVSGCTRIVNDLKLAAVEFSRTGVLGTAAKGRAA